METPFSCASISHSAFSMAANRAKPIRQVGSRAPGTLQRPGDEIISQDVPGCFRRLVAVKRLFSAGHFAPASEAIRFNAHQHDAAMRGASKAGLKKTDQGQAQFPKLNARNFHMQEVLWCSKACSSPVVLPPEYCFTPENTEVFF